MLKKDNPTQLQTIRFDQLNGLLDSANHITSASLCSLRILKKEIWSFCAITATLSLVGVNNLALEKLLKTYAKVFKEPNALPLVRSHDQRIPLKEWVITCEFKAIQVLRNSKGYHGETDWRNARNWYNLE